MEVRVKFRFLGISLLVIASSSVAQDQKNELTNEPKASAKVDKSDQLITNKRFRASTGSLSDFSLATTFIYRGGSIPKPLSANRPNIAGRADTASVARLNAILQGTYRLNPLNRINAGIGVQTLAPFQDSIDTESPQAQREFDRNQGDIDVFDPFISYRHMNKFFDVQTIFTAGLTQFTAGNMRDNGYQNETFFTLDTMYKVGSTGLSLGARFSYSKFFYDKNDRELRTRQLDQVATIEPQFEYTINETINLRTVFRTYAYQSNKADSSMDRRPSTQDVGLGISLTRDIFLFPNFQFSYDKPTIENTNVGLVANINMF
jgi:hypothetical protein